MSSQLKNKRGIQPPREDKEADSAGGGEIEWGNLLKQKSPSKKHDRPQDESSPSGGLKCT
jgi:hypothetical protein